MCFLMRQRPPRSPLFPYPTLFRSIPPAPCQCVSGVLVLGSSPALAGGGGGSVRLKQAPPLAVLAGLPLLGGPSRYAADRCGDAVLSRAGPKPCQTRDGRSWRTGPLFSLCPRVPSPVLPRCEWRVGGGRGAESGDRKSTRLNSSHANISYAVFCLKKKKKKSD